MKKLLALLMTTALLGLSTPSALAADDSPSQAKIMKITGSVMVKLPGAEEAVPATVGMMIPQGAEIITGEESTAFVRMHEGIMATADENTTINVEDLSVSSDGTRNALLNLKSGNLVSALDPSKKKFNNYGVRTPQGCCGRPWHGL